MIRFWGQPKYQPADGKLIGYELFLREYDRRTRTWHLPADFTAISPEDTVNLLTETLHTLPADLHLVSFNLNEIQFIDPRYCTLVTQLNAELPFNLIIELTEDPGTSQTITTAQIVDAAKHYHGVGIAVCMDDVGTGANLTPLVAALDEYAIEYKFALQNVRESMSTAEILALATEWHDRAQREGKLFAIEGFEGMQDVQFIQAFSPDVVQGYFYGKPHELPIQRDFTADQPED